MQERIRHSCENVNDGNTGLEKAFCFSCTQKQEKVTPEEARQIAEEAYIYAYPMLENYKMMFANAIYKGSGAYLATPSIPDLLPHDPTLDPNGKGG